MSSDIKVKNYLIDFAIDFCKENNLSLENIKNISTKKDPNAEWCDITVFNEIINEIRNQKKFSLIDKMGRDFFYYILNIDDNKTLLNINDKVKGTITEIYKLYKIFINAERLGMWKIEDTSRAGYLIIKENTPLPSDFTKGFIHSVVVYMGCKVVRVKDISDTDAEGSINEYEVSWMNKIK